MAALRMNSLCALIFHRMKLISITYFLHQSITETTCNFVKIQTGAVYDMKLIYSLFLIDVKPGQCIIRFQF